MWRKTPNGAVVQDLAEIHPRTTLGRFTKVHAFAYIEGDVVLGEHCVVKPHAFIPDGTMIGDHVFIGPGAILTNDKHPKAGNMAYTQEGIRVHSGASIGAGAVLLPGITIGQGALIGAGAVVTKSVPPSAVVAGIPARTRALQGFVAKPRAVWHCPFCASLHAVALVKCPSCRRKIESVRLDL